SAQNNTLTTAEDTAYTFSANGTEFGFSDPKDNVSATDDNFANVIITSLPSNGTLTFFNGTTDAPITTTPFPIPVGQINKLKYTPAANQSGALSSFQFQVQDSAGS